MPLNLSKARVSMYADDSTLYTSATTAAEMTATRNKELQLVLEYVARNRANLFLANHSETNCSSLLRVAVISVTAVADVYSVELSSYIETLALLKVSGMLLVNKLKGKGPKQLPWGIPDSTWIMFERLPLKDTLCVLLDK